jgi:hypothetical protein
LLVFKPVDTAFIIIQTAQLGKRGDLRYEFLIFPVIFFISIITTFRINILISGRFTTNESFVFSIITFVGKEVSFGPH